MPVDRKRIGDEFGYELVIIDNEYFHRSLTSNASCTSPVLPSKRPFECMYTQGVYLGYPYPLDADEREIAVVTGKSSSCEKVESPSIMEHFTQLLPTLLKLNLLTINSDVLVRMRIDRRQSPRSSI